MYIDNSIEKDTFNKYTASHIANFFLLKAKHDKVSDITAMKLVKLVYIAYAWYYAICKKKLFDEKIEAWRYGPVVPSIYHEFKRFRHESIDCFSINNTDDLFPLIYENDYLAGVILLRVWKSYKNKDGIRLSNITHGDEGFWKSTYSNSNEQKNYEEQLKLMAARAKEAIVKFYGERGLLLKEDIAKWQKENHV